MHFEKGVKPDERMNLAFAQQLTHFAEFNGCEKVIVLKAENKWKRSMEGILNESRKK
jgi:hypothetical protein